jgi:hypothetical protein
MVIAQWNLYVPPAVIVSAAASWPYSLGSFSNVFHKTQRLFHNARTYVVCSLWWRNSVYYTQTHTHTHIHIYIYIYIYIYNKLDKISLPKINTLLIDWYPHNLNADRTQRPIFRIYEGELLFDSVYQN